MYIDTGSPVPNIPSKSRGLADEKKKIDGMDKIRKTVLKGVKTITPWTTSLPNLNL